MKQSELSWLPDGFRVRFATQALPVSIRGELALLYGVLGGLAAVGLGDVLIASALLVPPPIVAWWATRRRLPAELEVDHQRLVARTPLGGRTEVPLREIQRIEVFDRAFELELWGGRRVRVPAPQDAPDRVWIVRHIRQLVADTQAFALELTEQLDAAWDLKDLKGQSSSSRT